MSTTPKKFSFADLQPHVDMLCDALENRGASSSGVPNEPVYHCAQKYRDLLQLVREKRIDYDAMAYGLADLREYTIMQTGDRQLYRVTNLVDALDIYIRKEYDKVNKVE